MNENNFDMHAFFNELGRVLVQSVQEANAQTLAAVNESNSGQITEAIERSQGRRQVSMSGGNRSIPVFHGRKDENLISWIFQVSDLFEAMGVDVDNRLKLVSGYLGGAALQWYLNIRTLMSDNQKAPYTDWKEFIDELKSAFIRPNNQFHLRRELRNLKQKSSMNDYVFQFRNLVGQLKNMSEEDLVLNFVEGLKDKTKEEVIYRAPVTLDSAIKMAVDFDSAKFNGIRKTWEQSEARESNGTVPMDISYANKDVSKRGRCHKCKQFGHWKAECPNSKKEEKKNKEIKEIGILSLEEGFVEETEEICDEGQQQLECAAAGEHNLLVFNGKINGIEGKILIDGGASHNFVAEEFVKENYGALQENIHEAPAEKVAVVDGSSHVSSKMARGLGLTMGLYKGKVTAAVMKIGKYDLILGKSWLFQNNPSIDWRENRIEIPVKDGDVVVLTAQKRQPRKAGSQIALNVIQRREFREVEEILCVNFIGNDEKSEVHHAGHQKFIENLKEMFWDVFQPLEHLPVNRDTEHQIILKEGATPVSGPLYRQSPLELQVLKEELNKLLKKGFIRSSKSSWASPVLFARKKDGTLRLCVDYRALNNLTVKHKYPIPRVDEMLDQLGSARVFSKIDLEGAYHHVKIAEKDIEKTAFKTRYGLFEYLVLPFGLCNGPATFVALMNEIFHDVLDKFIVIYIDDILVFSENEEQHRMHLEVIMERLQKNQLHVQLKKCLFFQNSIEFLGYIVGDGTIKMDSAKVKAISGIESPSSVTDVRSFLGLIGFYRKFIPNFAVLAKPLTELLKGNREFQWNEVEEVSFQLLKKAISEKPVLHSPNFNEPFILTTDASAMAVGGVLSQLFPDGEHPIAYESKKLTDVEGNYPTHELEMYAIVHCLKVFRCYLEGRTFVVRTDHASLKFVKRQKNLSRRMTRWLEYTQQFTFEIEYKDGRENVVADALSRLQINMLEKTDWPKLIPEYLETGRFEEAVDEDMKNEVKKYKNAFKVENDVVYYIGDLDRKVPFIPSSMRMDTVYKLHAGLGHYGQKGTLDLVKSRAWWPGMDADIRKWVSSCIICKKFESGKQRRSSEMMPLDYNIAPFSRWGLDFIGPLPMSKNGNRWIIVAVDYVTRWPVAKAMAEATTGNVAKFIYEEIVCTFGCPTEILTDRGANFNAEVLENYLKLLNVKHLRTSGYHPRTNGLTERTNGILKSVLRKLANEKTNNWDLFLSQALLSCRVRTHSTLNVSPFYLTYGVKPMIPGDTGIPQLQVEVDQNGLLKFREEQMQRMGEERLKAAAKTQKQQEIAKKKYDRTVKLVGFSRGDTVMITNEGAKALEAKWKGPYTVKERLSSCIYSLLDKNGNEVKPVNVDRMKRVTISRGQVSTDGYVQSGGECDD